MRSQRVKRIKRSKKSKMSKKIQRTKRVKRTKKTKRTKRSRRKKINRRRKDLKGGAYSWTEAEIVERFGRKTSETIEERKQRIRRIFNGYLDDLSTEILTNTGLPLLKGEFVTQLAEKYELTEDKVTEIFEEEKIKKIKKKIREIFNNFISGLKKKWVPFALEEDFLNLTSWNQLAETLSEELSAIGIEEGGKYSLQFVGGIFHEEKIKKLQEIEEDRIREAELSKVPDRDTSPERRAAGRLRKPVSFSSKLQERTPDNFTSSGTLQNITKKSKSTIGAPLNDHHGVYDHLRSMNLLDKASNNYASRLIEEGYKTADSVDALTPEDLSSLDFKEGHIEAIKRYRRIYDHLRRMNLLDKPSNYCASLLIKAGHITADSVDALSLEYLSSLGFNEEDIEEIERYRASLEGKQ